MNKPVDSTRRVFLERVGFGAAATLVGATSFVEGADRQLDGDVIALENLAARGEVPRAQVRQDGCRHIGDRPGRTHLCAGQN